MTWVSVPDREQDVYSWVKGGQPRPQGSSFLHKKEKAWEQAWMEEWCNERKRGFDVLSFLLSSALSSLLSPVFIQLRTQNKHIHVILFELKGTVCTPNSPTHPYMFFTELTFALFLVKSFADFSFRFWVDKLFKMKWALFSANWAVAKFYQK